MLRSFKLKIYVGHFCTKHCGSVIDYAGIHTLIQGFAK